MVHVHQGVGALVVIAFLILAVVNILRASGKSISWAKPLSFTAAGLLVVQYVLGFSLLGNDHKITAWHYIFALVAIIPVGIEHGMGNAKEAEKPGSGIRIAALASAVTTIIVIVAYAIGQSQGS
jgi:phosphoglycerol transferase MdoB-like AlkP superfamily enzyme